ncbi:hypothetical protein [Cryobacterium sp. Y11]|uniref:hypothetical protein n=1 Tax=Cryobacterium sp. Y11 TaxID=2045016 RepID=UPI000CE3E8C3|nr:hypothetical protein [Cryobacterium sp. Y11]
MKSFLLASAAILGATLLATATVGGTYALLNSSTDLGPAVTIQAGTATLTITSSLTMPSTALYPGARNVGTVTVQNDGTVPLQLRLAGLTPPTAQTTLSDALIVGAQVVSAVEECESSLAPIVTGTFANAPSTDLGTTLAPGAAAILCVSVMLTADAPTDSQSLAATNFEIRIDGRQV